MNSDKFRTGDFKSCEIEGLIDERENDIQSFSDWKISMELQVKFYCSSHISYYTLCQGWKYWDACVK